MNQVRLDPMFAKWHPGAGWDRSGMMEDLSIGQDHSPTRKAGGRPRGNLFRVGQQKAGFIGLKRNSTKGLGSGRNIGHRQ